MNKWLKKISQRVLPRSLRQNIVRQTRWPRVGNVNFGQLRRLKPISGDWGGDRGRSIDRYYIDRFLAANSTHIRGRVLEFGDDRYAVRFGCDRVTHRDILSPVASNKKATIVANLVPGDVIASDRFDCIICTQTLQFIANVQPAIHTLYRILAPGGIVLATMPTISQLEVGFPWNDLWRITSLGATHLFRAAFPAENIRVKSYGNVLAATAFLQGLAAEELEGRELDYVDPVYEILVSVQATKPS